ncbi:hypothetical protein CFAM422_011815 [Trichoderma lentiforme]|uniref:RING-type domain-containing protein n=1 Tax=Trichoderma lentiforme TaxID=1567552 RepID=A0A9P4X4T5_9HYPO|nr:hypothetical protein CFAM422_011815 [Trichoderma lentiforme]
MAPRRTSGSGSGFDLGMEPQPSSTLAFSTSSGSASTLPPLSAQAQAQTQTSASISASASISTSTLPPLHRSSRPPALSAASLFSASASASAAASPASGPPTATATATASPSTAPPQRLSFPFSPLPTSPAAISPSASAFAPASSTASASASASATAAAASSPFPPTTSTARPILPPLPPLPQVSPLNRFLSERPHAISHFSEFASPRPFPANLDSLTTLQPDPYSPLNSPFSRHPLLLGPQSTGFWSTYRTQLDQPTDWLQDDSAAPNIGVLAARAFGFNLSDFASSLTPFTSQPPLLQSPTQPPRRSPDLRFPFDSGSSPAPPPASIATSASALQAASATTSASAAPSSRHLPHARAQRATSTSRISATTDTPASPPASGQGFAHPTNSAEAAFDSDNSALDELFYELEGFPGFPLPIADTANTPSSLSTFTTMPPASRRSLRSRAQQPPEDHDSSASTPNARKRRRISTSAAQPTSLETVIDDDDGENWPLFGSTPPRPGSSADLKNEDFTTIDLTEVNDVPEELKKPEVDNRVKLSAFQCVICMDDVTGLTLTHCGHLFCAQCLYSSLSIESTRGKCPMCRAKIDMKPRDNYSTKTKGYWPLELKLMTRTRQGKRKAQAME